MLLLWKICRDTWKIQWLVLWRQHRLDSWLFVSEVSIRCAKLIWQWGFTQDGAASALQPVVICVTCHIYLVGVEVSILYAFLPVFSHLLMYDTTINVYSSRLMWFSWVVASLNMCLSVHSKKACRAAAASSVHTLPFLWLFDPFNQPQKSDTGQQNHTLHPPKWVHQHHCKTVLTKTNYYMTVVSKCISFSKVYVVVMVCYRS